MECDVIVFGDSWAILCGKGRNRLHRCVGCSQSSTLLCDGPGVAGRKTCDAPICEGCARQIGRDRHLCPGCDRPVTARAAAGPRHDEIESMFAGIVRLVSATPKLYRLDRVETPADPQMMRGSSARGMAESSSQPVRDSVQLSEQRGAAYRIHVHQLGASLVEKLGRHYGKKLDRQSWMVVRGMMSGQVLPIIGADLLKVIDGA